MYGIIKGEGHHLITAPTGELGVDLARTCQPDVVILELALPRMTGADAIVRLREDVETTAIPIIALSSAPCSSAPGLSMYCRRPLDVAGFARLLRELLVPAREPVSVRGSGNPPVRSRPTGDGARGLAEKRKPLRRSSAGQ